MHLFGLPEVVHSHMGVEPGPVIDALYMFQAWVKVKGSKLKLGDWDLGLTLGKGEYAWYPFLCNTWRSLNFRAALFTVAPVLLDEQDGYI